jgi:hypothetical protein
MTISQVALSNTFNEFRTSFNDTANLVNSFFTGSGEISANTITLTGELRGPSTFTIDPAVVGDDTGTVVIKGNLQVDGLTTTINSTTLTVDDKNIVIASGATTTASANGAGITIDGANANIVYLASNDVINVNKNVELQSANVTTLIASSDSSFTSTGALLISKGTTGQRTAGTAGQLRFNTTTAEFEGYNGASWASVGGSAISNDTSTANNLFPAFLSATTGTAASIFTSNAQYLFKPSTGELSVKVPRANNGIVVNSNTISSNYTIASGDNGMSAGPITIDTGVTVTVSSGSVWTVV